MKELSWSKGAEVAGVALVRGGVFVVVYNHFGAAIPPAGRSCKRRGKGIPGILKPMQPERTRFTYHSRYTSGPRSFGVSSYAIVKLVAMCDGCQIGNGGFKVGVERDRGLLAECTAIGNNQLSHTPVQQS